MDQTLLRQAFPANSPQDKLGATLFAAGDILNNLSRDPHGRPPGQKGTLMVTDICTYIVSLKTELAAKRKREQDVAVYGNVAKKQRTAVAPGLSHERENGVSHSVASALTVEGVSFSIPQRKKLTLEFAVPPGELTGGLSAHGIRAHNATTNEVEFTMAYEDIERVLKLPVPEKTQPQFNFVVIPKSSSTAAEAWVFTVPSSAPKDEVQHSKDVYPAIDTTASYDTFLTHALNKHLQHSQVTAPDPAEFQSSIAQPHRKDEPAFHIKAHRGAKDGFLYLLGPGILFGFKKPLVFLPFAAVHSISYTSVLQRTFNLSVVVAKDGDRGGGGGGGGGEEEEEEEIEFAMLDQADFAGIDAYVKRHGLHDASLAEGRKAKKFNVNRVVDDGGEDTKPGDGVNGEEGEGELAKAERELQEEEDEEDDEEEDYDPGSEGESEGEGASSGEDGGVGAGDDEADGEAYDEVDGEAYDEDEEEDALITNKRHPGL